MSYRLAALAWGVALSLITFAAFAVDKRAAARGRRRVPEATLHALELLGGWPGALVGAHVLRHKRRKLRYMAVLWGIALVESAGLAAVWWGA